MQRIWYSALLGVLLVIFSGIAAGGDCPDLVKLRAIYKGHPFISLTFQQLIHSEIFETVDTINGTLWAGQGGRFRLEMPGQAMISNGILYWSYSEENQQALLDSVARLGDWNPLTLVYDPEGVYQCRTQKADGEILDFEMVAVDSLTAPQQFDLRVTRGTYIPREIVYYDDNDSRIEVFIDEFTQPAELPDSLFIFRPGPGTEIIEMP